MPKNSVFSIAPHAPFLPTLADRIFTGILPGLIGTAPHFGLADLTIFVPTRRARTVLADAFLAQSAGAVLLPDIRTFGEQPEEEVPFLPPFEATELPTSIGLLSRRVLLARLVQKWVQTQEEMPFSTLRENGDQTSLGHVPPSAAEILALADSLAELIDDCHIEEVLPASIKSLVPDDLSQNWQKSLDFLSIVLDAWPTILAHRKEVDPAALRKFRMERQTAASPYIYGDRPVIAAGSTGSIPATADFLAAIANLPNGAIVLPGLDTSITADGHADLLEETAAPHGHPQYGMARLLRRLKTTHENVQELAPPTNGIRTQIVRSAMALPKDTGFWSLTRKTLTSTELDKACVGLTIALARTQEEEARTIAVVARDALSKGQTVAVVSPDRNLTRRVSAELARFDIIVDDSAGAPLFQSRIGRLLRQIIALERNKLSPVDLIAFLRNRFVTLGQTRADMARLTDLLEMSALRGQRPAPGVQGLVDIIEKNRSGDLEHAHLRLSQSMADELTSMLVQLDVFLAPLTALSQNTNVDPSALALALDAVLTQVVLATDAENLPDGHPEFKQWVGQMQTLTGQGPRFAGNDITSIVQGLMTGISVRPSGAARDDIGIFGVLEARLQSADLMILAGLNEGIWPQPADSGAWLSRNMRLGAGLEPPERQQGQMAHDFEMALGSQNVVLTLSERIGTSPALPSRFVQRCEAYFGADCAKNLRVRGAKWVALARRLDFAGTPKPATRPMPCPPADLRPKSLSVTEVETLMRSPYDLYAKHVLGLKPLDALGDDPDIRERGTLVHEIFAKFVDAQIDPTSEAALEKLLTIADEVFLSLETSRERRAIWRRRLEKQAIGYLDFERSRHTNITSRHVEIKGEWLFKIAGQDFRLSGRADRIDITKNGNLEIIDYKTGGVPAPAEMRNFTAPQLLAEAAIASNGRFKDIGSAPVSQMYYIKLAAGPDAFELSPFALSDGHDIAAAADELILRLNRHVEAFLMRDDLPMTARLFPKVGQRFAGAYDHLSRMDEWTEIDGEDESE